MYGNQAMTMGSSAYDLERIGALPEFPAYPQEERVPERAAPPSEKARVRTRTRAKTAQRQSVSKFAILGSVVVAALLLLVVLSHLQLAMISHEMVGLEGQLAGLREESVQLQIAYASAFNQTDVERFAREQLGMVDASPGQVFHLGAVLGDTAEILEIVDERDHGILSHLAGLFGSLKEYFSFRS
ncbi:MAG: hypothetical protein FWD99_03635 [Oscillospiraceae bacterium]|nr:hypothetical protein [Oscillospiraceae bacterium]